MIYGISAFGLANNLRISREDAKTFINTYFERFPEIKDYMDLTINFAKKFGYVETLFGRKIHTPNINGKGHTAGFAQRAAINAPIQGSAADIIKMAMILINNDSSLYNDCRMIMQVHDELVFEVSENKIDNVSKKIKNYMEGCITLNVPLKVELGFGKSWSDSH